MGKDTPKELTTALSKQTRCNIKINYEESIRSIDLENILTGFRMIYQHELATRTGKKTRDFTDLTKITSIEKGSISINLLFDWISLNIDLFSSNFSINIDLSLLILYYLNTQNNKVPEKLRPYINNIVSALQNVKSIEFHDDKLDAEIKSGNNGEIEINQKEKSNKDNKID